MNPDIAIPKALLSRPRDRRGYPIPMSVAMMRDGTPDFRVVNAHFMARAIRDRLCALSGKCIKPKTGAWLVGGPKSAFLPTGAYLDGPMLPECAEFALKVCPFLAAPRFAEKAFKEKGGGFEGMIVSHEQALKGRPEVFVAVHCNDWEVFDPGGGILFRPKLPYRAVSFWRHGRMLSHEQARAASDDIPDVDVISFMSEAMYAPMQEEAP